MGAKDVAFITKSEDQKEVFDYVLKDIKYLRKMIEDGKLDRQTQRIGAEQELCIVDTAFRPAPVIMKLLEAIDDPQFTTELAKFVLEINVEPLILKDNCFSQLERNLETLIEKGRESCKKIGDYDLMLTGILPTIRKMDLELENLTPNERSKAMIEAMKWLKKDDYSIRINGVDELSTTDFSNMFESCNTSFQIHYQVNPKDFAQRFNFAQAIAAPVLAACTNSPILFGKRLWHETRIALFQQAVDTRDSTKHLSEAYLRVPFGDKWMTGSVADIFEDDLAKFKIFLKHPTPDDTSKAWNKGETPKLVNLQTFNSSVFRWTRACYGVLDNKPHLRIENRLIPAGPTIKDEVANTAFWIGLMHGMPHEYDDLSKEMKFEDAKINALKAARYGLDTQFRWLGGKKIKAEKLIEEELLPIARKGLEKVKVDDKDIDTYLEIILKRVKSGKTGSQWMFDSWTNFENLRTADAKSLALTSAMKERQSEGRPVHEWGIAQKTKLNYTVHSKVGQLMSTDLFCVQEDDLIDQVVFSMTKKDYSHIPVADKEGNIKGLLNAKHLLERLVINGKRKDQDIKMVKDVMQADPITIRPSTTVKEAIAKMKEYNVKCLPVEHKDKLAGIITQFDIMRIAESMLEEKQEK